jgi:DNA primase catalytic core
MARIADDELEQLKRAVSIERLVQARGVRLKRQGKNLVGVCPFHEDKTPSLVVTPDKNLWHCLGACNAGGSVVDWVMKVEGVSFRHAVELLRADAPFLAAADTRRSRGPQKGAVPKLTTVRKLESGLEPDAGDDALLSHVVDYYQAALGTSRDALGYLEKRGLCDAAMVEHFRLGFSNRTLGYRLPTKTRKAGLAVRSRLEALGIYRESGHEHFVGSIVVPIVDAAGRIVQMYGRKISGQLREGTPLHLYLPRPHACLFNEKVVGESREVILCEAILDALSFWCAGFKNVVACYGASGFGKEHCEAMVQNGVERVYVAFDRDKAGDRGAEHAGAELAAAGVEVMRVLFPQGMDANEYALKVGPAEKSFAAALRGAVWLAGKRRAAVATPVDVAPSAEAAREEKHTEAPLLAAPPAPPAATTPVPVAERGAEDSSAELELVFGDRRWRLRGLDKPGTTNAELRINALVTGASGGFHLDTLDLYAARQRAAFVRAASEELGVGEDVVKKDLGAVLLELERRRDEARAAAAAAGKKSGRPDMSPEEREAALALLRDPKLLDRVLSDFELLGVVGERTNKLVGYLAATSRKLDEPLAVVIQSSSAAGKSSLMEAVLSFVPEEERVQYSAMTGQSLFYMGESDLRHKVLAIVEEEGAERASYALKLLQSEGELTIASTGKDPHTGRLVTEEYRVEGPVMIMLTTTAIDVDEELLNRALVLTVDEGRAQTRAIHARQRRAQTLAGVLEKEERAHVVALHKNAQRLLEPLVVVNPFAETLGFLDHRTRTRRDHMKYLTLIRTVALLHQHQREVKTVEHRGRTIRYVEVERGDIELAERLSREVLVRSIDELPPQTRLLHAEVVALAEELAGKHACAPGEVRFTRRQVRERTGWGLTQLKVHLRRLEELELVVVVAGGPARRMIYELAYDETGRGRKATGRPLGGGAGRPEEPKHVAAVTQPVGPGGPRAQGNGKSEHVVPAAARAARAAS